LVASSISVVLQGSGFEDGCTVSFGPAITVNQVKVVSSERITAQISIDSHAAPGLRDVTMALPGGLGGDTLRGAFTVTLPPPQLHLVSVRPANGVVPSLLTMVLQGSGFQDGCTVSFGPAIAINQVKVESSERITAQISIDGNAAPGSRDVTVTLPGGLGSDTLRGGFTLTPLHR
jgi:uncharacterized membrane protein